eukprot:g23259.t1
MTCTTVSTQTFECHFPNQMPRKLRRPELATHPDCPVSGLTSVTNYSTLTKLNPNGAEGIITRQPYYFHEWKR